MYKLLFIILPFFFVGCSPDSSDDTAETEIYTASSTVTEERPMLVIRLTFQNEPTFAEDEAYWQQKLFSNASGNLNHYYNEISAGQFRFSPVRDASLNNDGITTLDLSSVVHPNPRTQDPEFSEDLTHKVHPIFKVALEKVSSNGFDFSHYDENRNGAITPDELIIMFVLAGQEDAYSTNYENGIWAHEWCTDNDITANDVSLLSCDDGGDYAVFGERHDDHDATIGIIAHELGHVTFQLPDLYYGSSSRIGYYGLMSNGSWGQNWLNGEAGDTPTHMCAWSKIDTGWYSASSISNSTEVNLHASGSGAYNIVKVPLLNTSNEYFLLENRGLYGYDTGLNIILDSSTGYTGGVAIWHIDETVIQKNRDNNSINADARHKGVDLEEAAGASVDYDHGDPSQNFYFSGNNNTFTPYTTPNSNDYNGRSSGVSITNISAIASTMSAQIEN